MSRIEIYNLAARLKVPFSGSLGSPDAPTSDVIEEDELSVDEREDLLRRGAEFPIVLGSPPREIHPFNTGESDKRPISLYKDE